MNAFPNRLAHLPNRIASSFADAAGLCAYSVRIV